MSRSLQARAESSSYKEYTLSRYLTTTVNIKVKIKPNNYLVFLDKVVNIS